MIVPRIRRLRRSELPVDTVELGRYLIGKALVHDLPGGRLAGRIVETEAYVVGDEAGHAFIGPTRRNSSLFLERGRAYVYFIYGSAYCLNVASETHGVGAGVLLRALEPLEGIAEMERERGTTKLKDLARGPGRLARQPGAAGRSDRQKRTDRIEQGGSPTAALLRARQPVRERAEAPARLTGRASHVCASVVLDPTRKVYRLDGWV
jgi:DNA-3-methyladenine glycosylase